MNKPWKPAASGLDAGSAEGPYPGLRPFLAREREIFFGREQMIDQVLVHLNERHMVVVHGASGCGKSSLIAAGVLPQLARRRARLGRVLAVRAFRPGSNPVQKLVQILAELCGTEKRPAELEVVYRALARDRDARAEVARLAAAAGVDQLCIVVDQFEELFRFAEDGSLAEAQHFAELIVRLAGQSQEEERWWEEQSEEATAARTGKESPGAEISFILTMRSEFLGDCSRYPGLAEAINRTQYLLPNMTRPDLIRAVREPAEVFGGSVDHDLAERIAEDAVREQDSLPLVQHALRQLWRVDEDHHLTLAEYEKTLADSRQDLKFAQRSPLGAVLADHADAVLAKVTGGDERLLAAAEFIFRALSKKDSQSRAIRCQQSFRRLVKVSGVTQKEARAIVNGFRREGVSFLTPYAAMQRRIGPDDIIDISHEALMRGWPRMSERAIDPETARPFGWVEREAQDAMLWRWMAVHADFFRSNPEAFLDGATTDRLKRWLDERLRCRAEWVRPHLVHAEGYDDPTAEPEWQAVDYLLTRSWEKAQSDRSRLQRWKVRGISVSLLFLILFVISSVAAIYYYRESLRPVVRVITETVQPTPSVPQRADEPERSIPRVMRETAEAQDRAARSIVTPRRLSIIEVGQREPPASVVANGGQRRVELRTKVPGGQVQSAARRSGPEESGSAEPSAVRPADRPGGVELEPDAPVVSRAPSAPLESRPQENASPGSGKLGPEPGPVQPDPVQPQ